MPKITMCRGLPASGKSTWAKAQVLASNGQTKRVNMDLLREMFDASEWSKGNEKFMQSRREDLIWQILGAGKNVIVDDVNLHPKHEAMLRKIATDAGATFVIKDFTNVPVEECIRRDLARERSVGERIIRKFARDFLEPKAVSRLAPPEHVPGAPRAIIVDIDGTVAQMNGRGPHDYDKVLTDIPREQVIAVVRDWVWGRAAQDPFDYHLIFCSGRPELCRDDTVAWLEKNVLSEIGDLSQGHEWSLFMRPTYLVDPKSQGQQRDFRNDAIVKTEIYHEYIEGHFNVDFVIDDRDRVVRAWRDLGLLCFQCADGDF